MPIVTVPSKIWVDVIEALHCKPCSVNLKQKIHKDPRGYLEVNPLLYGAVFSGEGCKVYSCINHYLHGNADGELFIENLLVHSVHL